MPLLFVVLFSIFLSLIGCTTQEDTIPWITVRVSDIKEQTEPYTLVMSRLQNLAESTEAKQYVAILQDGHNYYVAEPDVNNETWTCIWEKIGYFEGYSDSSKPSGYDQELLQKSPWFQITDFDYYVQSRFETKPTWTVYDGKIEPLSSSAKMLEADIQQLNTDKVLK